MDQFKHSDNIGLNRKDMFNALQNMIYGNLSKLLRGIYNIENLKIICGNSEIGLLSEDDFMVSYSNGYISVMPGVATNDAESLMYLSSTSRISSALSNGAYRVYVQYKQNKALTGKEVVLPTKGNINTDSLYTLLTDSAEIGITSIGSPVPTGSIELAIVVIASSLVPSAINYGTLSRDLYMDEVDILIPRTSTTSVPAWGLDHYIAKIGDEYIEIDASGNILSRGYYDTIVEHHYAGETISIISIIDKRQQSLLKMRGEDAIEKAMARGVAIVNGGEYRSMSTRRIKRHSTTPVISSSTPPVLWENRSRAMNMITERVKNVYYGIQSSGVTISNNKAIIQDLRSRMLGAGEEERAVLAVEMKRAQQELISSHNAQQEALSVISTDEISGYMKSTPNMFSYVIDVSHASMANDGVVQYEAEVMRSPVSSMAGNNSASTPDRYYSDRIRPVGFNIKGDPIYPSRHASERNYIKIPISIGERVSVKVRAINENDIFGEYSNIVTYEFARYDDNEYVSYQGIYDVIVPDILSSAATLKEYVEYIKDLWDRMSSTNEQIRGYQTSIDEMKNRLTEIEINLLTFDPIRPVVSKLKAIADVNSVVTGS